MKLTVASVIFSVALASCASARSTASSRWPQNMEMNPRSGQVSGAAYFMTNEPTGNYIIASDIGSDGKLNTRRAVYTGGLGGHSNNGGGGDGLLSQGSVAVSSTSNMLAVVNAGSSTISLFSIDPSEPSSLKLVGAPISSGGQFPNSVAFNKDGDMVCALNSGEVNGVSCFSVSPNSVTPLTQTQRSLGLNQTTPSTGPPGSPSQIFISPDGQNVVVSVKGIDASAPGYLAIWDITNGTLSTNSNTIPVPTGGQLPFGFVPIANEQAFVVSDPAIGFNIIDMSGQNRSAAYPIDGQKAVCWAAFSSKTGNYYMIDAGASLITEIAVDGDLKASAVKSYSTGNNTGPLDPAVATIGDKDFLYTLTPGTKQVNVMMLNGAGQAQTVQSLDITGHARSVNVPVNSTNLQGMATFFKV